HLALLPRSRDPHPQARHPRGALRGGGARPRRTPRAADVRHDCIMHARRARGARQPGHVGTLRSILLPNGKRALVIGARTHFYEGHGVRRVVHSVRTAAAAGATTMILTNGAGGIKEHWTPGTPVLISDHINLTAASPLEGAT